MRATTARLFGVRLRECRLRHVVLGADTAREAVAGEAVDAAGLARAAVVDRDRDWNGCKPSARAASAIRRAGAVSARAGTGSGRNAAARRVVARAAVHLQQRFGLAVVRLEIGIADRPAREVGRAQAQRRPAEEDRVAADDLVGERLDGRRVRRPGARRAAPRPCSGPRAGWRGRSSRSRRVPASRPARPAAPSTRRATARTRSSRRRTRSRRRGRRIPSARGPRPGGAPVTPLFYSVTLLPTSLRRRLRAPAAATDRRLGAVALLGKVDLQPAVAADVAAGGRRAGVGEARQHALDVDRAALLGQRRVDRGPVAGGGAARHLRHPDVAGVPARQRLGDAADAPAGVALDLHVVGAQRAVGVDERGHLVGGRRRQRGDRAAGRCGRRS